MLQGISLAIAGLTTPVEIPTRTPPERCHAATTRDTITDAEEPCYVNHTDSLPIDNVNSKDIGNGQPSGRSDKEDPRPYHWRCLFTRNEACEAMTERFLLLSKSQTPRGPALCPVKLVEPHIWGTVSASVPSFLAQTLLTCKPRWIGVGQDGGRADQPDRDGNRKGKATSLHFSPNTSPYHLLSR
ncbi:hypothetical protein VTN00DRAFT_2371 [Thermoascus crustaceus]|uniref:uncharacterized protein n=1 Tax=Thermoascus crustaceus TaxID=5088 RepID=UPI003741E988